MGFESWKYGRLTSKMKWKMTLPGSQQLLELLNILDFYLIFNLVIYSYIKRLESASKDFAWQSLSKSSKVFHPWSSDHLVIFSKQIIETKVLGQHCQNLFHNHLAKEIFKIAKKSQND